MNTLKIKIVLINLVFCFGCYHKVYFHAVKIENIQVTEENEYYYSCVALHDTIVKKGNKLKLNAQNDTLIVRPVYLYFFYKDSIYRTKDTILIRQKNNQIKIMK